MAREYVLALVHKDGKNYGTSFPDYPGCISGGSSFAEAVERGANALAFHLSGMAEDGDPIPRPLGADAAMVKSKDDLADGAMPIFLEVEFPGKAVRINISMDESLLLQVDRVAKANNQTRSAFLAEAAKSRLLDA